MKLVLQGECLCGGCRFEAGTDSSPQMFLCHCSRCRKESGTVHGASVFLPDGKLKWIRGESNIRHFLLEGTRKARVFCTNCGSPVPRLEGRHVVVPAGSLDSHCDLSPTAHIHWDSRAKWEDSLKSVPSFPGLPT